MGEDNMRFTCNSLLTGNIRICKIFFLLAALITNESSIASSPKGPSLDGLLAEIQNTLIHVQQLSEDDSLPSLNSVKLSLQTAFTGSTGAKINLFIITLGAEISKENVQQLDITLIPPKPGQKDKVSDQSFSKELASAIVNAANIMKKARDRKPPLEMKNLTATLKFVVKKSGEASATFALIPLSPSLGGKINQSEIQTIIFSYGKK